METVLRGAGDGRCYAGALLQQPEGVHRGRENPQGRDGSHDHDGDQHRRRQSHLLPLCVEGR